MKKGFTLIELLIVVAIIAILAAIAVPNFLEAQTRAKVSRTKADMRTMVTGLETYKIDTGAYPSCAGNGYGAGASLPTGIRRAYAKGGIADPKALYTIGFELSTPIAYLTGMRAFVDPFRASKAAYYASDPNLSGREMYGFYNSRLIAATNPGSQALKDKITIHGEYIIASGGPDGYINNGVGGNADYKYGGGGSPFPFGRNYDSTNGTVSIGDIVRCPKYGDGGWERTDNL